jgi:hypothetical protein
MAVITLKVRIEMTPGQIQEYASDNGCDWSVAGVREDIRRYTENHLQCSALLNCEEGLTEGIAVK